MKVTSTKSVSFPKFDWGITAGEIRDLPEDKDAQDVILAHPAITKADAPKSKSDTKDKDE